MFAHAICLTEPEHEEKFDSNGNLLYHKTMFRMKSVQSGKEIDCIVWKDLPAHIGDEVIVDGFIEKTGKCFVAKKKKCDKYGNQEIYAKIYERAKAS